MTFHWIPFLVYAITTTATPGPNNIMSMSMGGRFGFRKALPFNMGIWDGFSVVMILCTIMSSLLLAFIPMIGLAMQILGVGYILYLAWDAFHSHSSLESAQRGSGARQGFLLQFINPKIYVYGFMSMNTYIMPVIKGQTVTLLYFARLFAFIGIAFTLLWSAFGSTFKWPFTGYVRIVNSIMAVMFVFCAISLLLE